MSFNMSSYLHVVWGSTTSLCFGFEIDIHYYPLMPHLFVLERMGNIPSCFLNDTCKFIDSAVVWVSWGVFLSDWRVLVILVIPHLKVAPCLTVLLRNLPIFPWPSLRWEDTTALWVTMKHPPVSHCGWDCVLVMKYGSYCKSTMPSPGRNVSTQKHL